MDTTPSLKSDSTENTPAARPASAAISPICSASRSEPITVGLDYGVGEVGTGCGAPGSMSRVKAEGWYHDPWTIHDDRWFSDGRPTGLVRDHGVESQDPPPEQSFDGPLEEIESDKMSAGADLKRVDDPDTGQARGNEYVDAACDVEFGAPGTGMIRRSRN